MMKTKLRQLNGLSIRSMSHLALMLSVPEKELLFLSSSASGHYREFVSEVKGKKRHLVSPTRRLRGVLSKIDKLLKRVPTSSIQHGAKKNRSILSNAIPHLNANMVLKMDLEKCFPSISNRHVYKTFCKELHCTPNVARVLTQLTTHKGSLPLGSPASPQLANLILLRLSNRIRRYANEYGLTSTLFVDDFSISGDSIDLEFVRGAEKIIRQEGFKTSLSKRMLLTRGLDKIILTGVDITNGIDAPREFMDKVRSQLKRIVDSVNESAEFSQQDSNSLAGRIAYLNRLNPGASSFYKRKLRLLTTHTKT